MGSYRKLWENMEMYEKVWESMLLRHGKLWEKCKCMRKFGKVLEVMGNYGKVWKCISRYWKVCKCMRKYGDVWEGMGK